MTEAFSEWGSAVRFTLRLKVAIVFLVFLTLTCRLRDKRKKSSPESNPGWAWGLVHLQCCLCRGKLFSLCLTFA